MLSGQQLINEVLIKIKEPYDPNFIQDLSHYPRAEILNRLNLEQDEIALYIPDLIRTGDTSLSTVSGQQEYNLPSTIGTVYQVSVNEQQLLPITKDWLATSTQRGEINTWLQEYDQPYYYYVTNDNTLGIWPPPTTAGWVITIDGEMVLTQLTDDGGSYPLANIPALRKAQKILIWGAAQQCASDEGNSKQSQIWQMEKEKQLFDLKAYWSVMRQSEPASTIVYYEVEDVLEQNYLPPSYYVVKSQ